MKTKLSSSLSVLRQAGLIAPLVFAPALAFGDDFSTPGTTNLVVPPNVFQVTLVAVGGGGHGGFGGRDTSGGGGGGGGSCILTDYSVTPGQTLAVTVGAGGTSGNTGATGGSYVDNGEPSGVQLGNTGGAWLVRAAGGNGVDTGVTGGGTGGAGCVGSTGGAIGYSGGNGGNGRGASGAGGGGGGGAAGAGGAGATGGSNTSGTTGAAGGTGGIAGPTGSTPGGTGGQGGTDGSTGPGATGSSPGGGGGGGADDIGSGNNWGTPGNGANGLVQILYAVATPDLVRSTICIETTAPCQNDSTVLVTTTVDIVVTVLDEDENPLTGVSVLLNQNPANPDVIISSNPAPTDANGIATFQVVSATPTTVTFTATTGEPINGSVRPSAALNDPNGVTVNWTTQQSIAPIPTMGQFGLLTMAGVLGLFVAWRQRRRG